MGWCDPREGKSLDNLEVQCRAMKGFHSSSRSFVVLFGCCVKISMQFFSTITSQMLPRPSSLTCPDKCLPSPVYIPLTSWTSCSSIMGLVSGCWKIMQSVRWRVRCVITKKMVCQKTLQFQEADGKWSTECKPQH